MLVVLLLLVSVWAQSSTSVSGIVLDSVSGLGVPYARIQYSATQGLSGYVFSNPNGTYFIPYSTSLPTIIGADHAAYAFFTPLNSSSYSIILTPLASSNLYPFGDDGSNELLRIQLQWFVSNIDVDMYLISACGYTYYNTRLRAVGGVATRMDNDFLGGYGIENLKILGGLPCGDYDVYVKQASKSTYFRDNQCSVSFFYPSNPTVPFVQFTSFSGGNNYVTWWVATIQVRVVNQATRQRSYNFIQQNQFSNSALPTGLFLPACALDSQWCRTIQGSASVSSVCLMVIAAILMLLFA